MISFQPLNAPLGAIVAGFDPTETADPQFPETLASGLLEHSVLVFRGQVLTPGELVALGRSFGDLEILPEPDKRHPVHPEIFNLTNVRADGQLVEFNEPQAVFLRGTQRWHTDSSFRAVPALCTMLYAVEVPAGSGNTQFADMRAAADRLPRPDYERLAQHELVHSYEYSRGNNPGQLNPMSEDELANYPPVEHPWVRSHADGTKSLYMGGHASHVAGLDEAEGRSWIADIESQAMTNDIIYEHQWQADDLVVWDNRTTLHRLMGYDIANERRVMRRITVAGTEPVR